MDSGDFSINGEILGAFERRFKPSYDFFLFLIFFSSSCVLLVPYGLHTPKIFEQDQFYVKVLYISNFLLIFANFLDIS